VSAVPKDPHLVATARGIEFVGRELRWLLETLTRREAETIQNILERARQREFKRRAKRFTVDP
jgi:hypothetical protein